MREHYLCDTMTIMEEVIIITTNDKETKKTAEILAKEFLKTKLASTALVIGLEGDLGGGKTTFTQGFAKGLGIKEKIISPTFIVMRKHEIRSTKSKIQRFKTFIHIDAYRLEEPEELEVLGWDDLVRDPKNIIIVEWANKIKRILPKNYIQIKFKHIKENERQITLSH